MTCVVFDWKRTLYDPDEKRLMGGAQELLQWLDGRKIPMVLIGKGDTDMYDEVDRLGVRQYFSHVMFREGAKGTDLFAPFIDKSDTAQTIFIGDRVRSELAAGNALGATTIWVRQGKFAGELPEHLTQEPVYTVTSLAELKSLLTTMSKTFAEAQL